MFLSHCLLNENTRYLGGTARPGCVQEIVDACADADLGMVQLPCPEERAWDGVRKRRLRRLYGSSRWLPRPLRRAARPALGVAELGGALGVQQSQPAEHWSDTAPGADGAQQPLPCQAFQASRSAITAITRPATESAQPQPRKLLRTRPTSTTPDR